MKIISAPKLASEEAKLKYQALLNEREQLLKQIAKIDEEIKGFYPTIEVLSKEQEEHYQERLEEINEELRQLQQEREQLQQRLKELETELTELEAEQKELERIQKTLNPLLKWGNALAGLFSVLIALRILSTSDLFNQSFGIIPGILQALHLEIHNELAQRIVLVLDFLVVETLIALFIYVCVKVILLAVGYLLQKLGGTKLQVYLYSTVMLISFATFVVTFLLLTVFQ